MYSINRTELAQMIAAHLSGFKSAEPNADDFELADKLIATIEESVA